MRATQMFDLGPVGVAKVYPDPESGTPVVVFFSGAEEGGTPTISHIWDVEGINGLIALGRALQAYHQVPVGGKPKDSSAPGGLTLGPI